MTPSKSTSSNTCAYTSSPNWLQKSTTPAIPMRILSRSLVIDICMGIAAIYCYWNKSPCKVWEHPFLPVVQSIACLRRWTKDVSVYVMDLSDHDNEWGEFPDMLGFSVHKREHHMRWHPTDYQKYPWVSPHMLSRPATTYNFALEIPEDQIWVTDIDLFYIKPPTTFEVTVGQKIVTNGNNGLWKFNKNWDELEFVIDLWQSHCVNVVFDTRYFKKVLREAKQEFMHEEAVYRYLVRYFPQYFTSTPPYENSLFGDLATGILDPHRIIGLHVQNWNYVLERNKRSTICFYLKEINDIMKEMFSEAVIETFYGSDRAAEPVTVTDLETMRKWGIE